MEFIPCDSKLCFQSLESGHAVLHHVAGMDSSRLCSGGHMVVQEQTEYLGEYEKYAVQSEGVAVFGGIRL